MMSHKPTQRDERSVRAIEKALLERFIKVTSGDVLPSPPVTRALHPEDVLVPDAHRRIQMGAAEKTLQHYVSR